MSIASIDTGAERCQKKKSETDLPAKGLSRRGYYFDRRRFRARRVVCAPVRGMIVYVRHVHKYARRPPTLSSLFVVSTSRKRDYQSYFVRRTRRRSIMGGGGPVRYYRRLIDVVQTCIVPYVYTRVIFSPDIYAVVCRHGASCV